MHASEPLESQMSRFHDRKAMKVTSSREGTGGFIMDAVEVLCDASFEYH